MKINVALLTLLLNSGLLFIGATARGIASCVVDVGSFRLPNHVMPHHYDIELELLYLKESNNTLFDFNGKVNVSISVLRKTDCISLHAQRPYINVLRSVLVKRYMDIKTGLVSVIDAYHNESNTLTFYFNTVIKRGYYNLILHFCTKYDSYDNANSLFKTFYEDRKGIITYVAGTHFQAIGARKVFPCWDEPRRRANFTISIKHHKKYTILSNIPKVAILRDKGEKVLSLFSTTSEIPTYLVAITIFDIPNFQLGIDNKVGRIWLRRTVSQYVSNFTETFVTQVAEHLQKKLEIVKIMNIPQPSLDIVAIPGLLDNSIANWGLILFREADIVYDKKLDPAMQKIRVASLVAREMAHHWYGNYISPSWWNNIWINDGIAMLLGTHTIDKIYPNFRILDLFVVQTLHESLHLDSFALQPLYHNLTIKSPEEINLLFSLPRYIKASSILRMLQHVLADHVFWRGVETHLRSHWLGNANSDDFWYCMKDAQSQYNLSHEKMLNVQRWMDKTFYPVLNVERNYVDSRDILISVDNLGTQEQDEWWIPVTITTETECNFTQSFRHNGRWLKTTFWHVPYGEFRLPYEENGWIIVNLQQTGYYRVNYDYENWLRIIFFLQVKNYANIHVLNRAQIIDDAFHLMLDHKLHSLIFWNLTYYLHRETDYIAWYPMFKALERMSSIFPLQANKVTEIKIRLQSLLTALLKNIGYNEDVNENDLTKFLRQEAARWACTLNATECIHVAANKLKQHLINSKEHKLLPWWKHWTYCNGLIEKNNTMIWINMIRKYGKNFDYDIVEALTYNEKFRVIDILFQLIWEETNIISNTKHRVYGFFHIIAKHARRNEILDYLLHNFEKIKPKEISLVAALVHIINHVYTRKQIWKIHKFTKRTIDDKYVYLAIEHKTKSRWYEIKRQFIYLMNF